MPVATGVTALARGATAQTFETTARSRRDATGQLVAATEEVVEGKIAESLINGGAAASTGTGWVRGAVDAADSVRKASSNGSLQSHLPALYQLHVVEGTVGALVAVARMPERFSEASSEIAQAMKTKSRQDQLRAVGSSAHFAATVVGASMGLSNAVWAFNDVINPYLEVKRVVAAASPGLSSGAVHTAARNAIKAAKAAKAGVESAAPFIEEATAALSAATRSPWGIAAQVISKFVPVAYTTLEVVNLAKTEADPKASAAEKYYARLALAGSTMATAVLFVPAVVAGAALTMTTMAAAPALLAVAGLTGAAAWAYATYEQSQAKQERGNR